MKLTRLEKNQLLLLGYVAIAIGYVFLVVSKHKEIQEQS